MTRILVTGAGGLIGSRVAAMAEAAGHEVVRLKHSGLPRPGVIIHDLTRPLHLPPFDWVFHLAGGYAGASGRALRQIDLAMAERLAEWNGAHNWIIASAAEVYGRIDGVGTEAAPLKPVFAYGAVKLAVERVFAALPAERVVLLRIGEVYGPGSKLLDTLTGQLRRGRCLWPGSGRVSVSFVHADDAAAAFLAALDRAPGGVSAFNVADAAPSSWRDFLSRLATMLGTAAPVLVPLPLAKLYAMAAQIADRAAGRPPLMTLNTLRLLTTPKAL